MIYIFYLVTAVFLSILPALNGYVCVPLILFTLALLSPVRTLLVQWCVAILWILMMGSPCVPPLMIDEYYLYLSFAVIFIIGTPFYVSHLQRVSAPWVRSFLVPTRYMLLTLAALFLLSTLFRSYLLSNIVWAFLCFIYGYFLPRRHTPMRCVTAVGYVLLFSLITVATFALVEVGVRLFFVAPPEPGGYYMPHGEAIFTLRPNSSAPVILKNNHGKTIQPMVEISGQGIRDREFGPKSGNEYRIVMIGDSFAMGHGLEGDQTIGHFLENMLAGAKEGVDIQVINCGVGGYAPWQERIFLNERGFAFEPDLVILQLYPINDVPGSYSKVGKYLDSVDIEWEYVLRNFRRQHELPFRLERLCQQRSHAYRLTLSAMRSVVRPIINLLPSTSYPVIASRCDRPPSVEVCLVTFYPGLQEAWDIFRDSIRGIRDDCEAKDVPLIAYAHSGLIAAEPETWAELNRRFPDTPYEMNKDITFTNQLLEELGIPYVDVLSALLQHSLPDLYFIHDGHFNPQGAEVVATCLRDYLVENNFLR